MRKLSANSIEVLISLLSIAFILFWMYVAGSKLYDFNDFKDQIHNQVFSTNISNLLIYVLPVVEITIAGLLVYSSTRMAGMILSFLLMLAFSTYVGLAIHHVFNRMPCNCAALLGKNSSWEANFKLNLFVTAVAATWLILTLIFRYKERRKKGMHTTVSHAPLPA